jgi:hypothetical protein
MEDPYERKQSLGRMTWRGNIEMSIRIMSSEHTNNIFCSTHSGVWPDCNLQSCDTVQSCRWIRAIFTACFYIDNVVRLDFITRGIAAWLMQERE